jgi:hypothetical protein
MWLVGLFQKGRLRSILPVSSERLPAVRQDGSGYGCKFERKCYREAARSASRAESQWSVQWGSRDGGRARICTWFESGLRREPGRGATQGLPGWQSDICIQRTAVRVVSQSVPKANASQFPSVAANIGQRRSGPQPAEALLPRPRATIARLKIFQGQAARLRYLKANGIESTYVEAKSLQMGNLE